MEIVSVQGWGDRDALFEGFLKLATSFGRRLNEMRESGKWNKPVISDVWVTWEQISQK